MAITSDFTNIATTTRASKAWDGGAWDFVSGSAVGALVEYAANAPRITSSGLLVEETTTNEITNPRAEGTTAGVVGSGGVMPTNWTIIADEGFTEIVGTGTSNGWPYLDMRINGTPTADPQYTFEGSTQITAATGDDWTQSLGVQVVGGTLNNITDVSFRVAERTSGGSLVAQTTSAMSGIDSTHQRFFYSVTLSGGGTVARVVPQLYIDWDGGGDIDVTLRLFAPQMEQKAYPTSPVLPTAGAPNTSTRNDDDISIANGSWSNDDGDGTHFVEFKYNHAINGAGFARIVSYGTDTNNSLRLVVNSGASSMRWSSKVGAVTQFDLTGSAWVANQTYKAALSCATNDIRSSINGTTATDTSAAITFGASSSLQIGAEIGGGNNVSGMYVQDYRYFPRQLAATETDALGSA